MWDPDPVGSIINWPSGFGSVIQDYGSADPDPKEIFIDQHTFTLFENLKMQETAQFFEKRHVIKVLDLHSPFESLCHTSKL
jgi:hypothetical protein